VPPGLDPKLTDLHAYDALSRTAEPEWTAATVARHGRIDAIVANAGLFTDTSVIDAEEDAVDRLLEVNLRAPRRLARAAWPMLQASGRGRVAILGSLSGKRVASKGSALYSVSKFAAIGLAHALRYEGWEDGIRATAFCPGLVATDMGATAAGGAVALDEMTRPEDVAHLVMEVISLSNSASVPEIHINWRTDGIF
jgi:NAD(P)-dependent dehydrogenase (short-subunit alcohol dehydrogenase family)